MGSVGFSKDVSEVLARRPSFASTLKAALEGTAPLAPGVKRGGGWLMKQSTTGRWNRRFFVVHGHYLSYFKDDRGLNKRDTGVPAGTLDLWHVESCTLEDTVLSLQLSEHASESRRGEMGSKVVRKTKELVKSAQGPFAGLAKTAARRLEVIRRGETTPKMILKADTSSEAQLWLAAMRESPFMGQLAKLALEAHLEGPPDALLRIQELRVHVQRDRQYIYSDAAALFDGATSILVRDVPPSGGKISVTVKALDGSATETVSAPFEPALSEAAGTVQIPLIHLQQGNAAVVIVEWQRHRPNPARAVAASGGALVVVFAACLVLGMSLRSAFVLAVVSGAGTFATMWRRQHERNDVVLVDVGARAGEGGLGMPSSPRPSEGLASGGLAGGSTPATKSSGVGLLSGGRKRRAVPPSTVGVSRSPDLNVTLEESAALVDLRERVKDLWTPDPVEADAFVKRHQRVLEEWGADLGALKNLAKRKRVLDKQILSDFRCVRFLRARKHNIDKAETMMRESLTIRIAFGFEEMHEADFHPPQWLIEYNGSPIISKILRLEPDTEVRFSRFWLRDREGHLCMFLRNGRMNSRRVFRKCGSNATFLIKCLIWAAELVRHDLEHMHIQTKGKVESLVTAVIDLDGFAISDQIPVGDLIGIARRWFPIMSVSFPELLARVLVFNAPWLFGSLWSAMKPFIPEEVLEKIQIHSGTLNVERHIRPYIDNQFIPAYMGGALHGGDDGDPFCSDRLPPMGPYLPDHGDALLEGVDPDAAKPPRR